LLKNKKYCADVYCVTLIELQAHHDAFIQNISIATTDVSEQVFRVYTYGYMNV